MQVPPLKAVVLDNDETTGSYLLIFGLTAALKRFGYEDNEAVGAILERLAKWMVLHHCFRPGLLQLLQTLVALRKNNKIDAIIMYTNQKTNGAVVSSSTTPFLSSVPVCIAYMMEKMCGEKVFDHILTRPEGFTPIGTMIPKYFTRILDLYPDRPRDIRDICFVDDLAYPSFVKSDGIPRCAVEDNSWYPVDAYYKILTDKDIMSCLEYVFYDINKVENMIAPMMIYVLMNQAQQKSSTPNASVFLKLCQDLQKRFGFAPKRGWNLHKPSGILTDTDTKHGKTKGCRAEACEADDGACEGEHGNPS